ncbi:MAG: hypothetical protein IT204_15930 [Fimbriimonadaceae bacterium]|nr:hypothetical protein [Fimbriimonadaceae bacterium]
MRYPLPAADLADLLAVRTAILAAPLQVATARAAAYTRVWQEHPAAPWIVLKALALREHLRTVPLWLRPGDRLAGSLTETPGALPLLVELGIGENGIFTTEDPHRAGYLRDQVPAEILEFWERRNMWAAWQAYLQTVEGWEPPAGETLPYKFLSCQGHLSPAYSEVLAVGLGGLRAKVAGRLTTERDPRSREFLTAAALTLQGLSTWIGRYAALLADDPDPARREVGAVAARLVDDPPETFREALQLVWFCQQAIHIEGHGYSNTPDRLDQILLPFYEADRAAGRIDDAEVVRLCANFVLKMRDNTFWSVEHNLTQGICLGGSTVDGLDQTNPLSWLWLQAAAAMALPEPLVWVRCHAAMDRDFLDYCLQTIAGPTCFPLFMGDHAVPAMLAALGVDPLDAANYVAAGCNELAVPGMAYFNPCAYVNYLAALERAVTQGRGYRGQAAPDERLPDPAALNRFEDLTAAIGTELWRQVEQSYRHGLRELEFQRRYAQSPLTSCFFADCLEQGHDLIDGTRYNILSCGGTAFANLVDCLAALREVVYQRGAATLDEVAAACAANFAGHEALRAQLLAAPKHGNDDPRLEELVALVERLRDEPVKAICRDPRSGTPFGNCHVVRSSAVLGGRHTGATPDGRLAGAPLASSVAACGGAEQRGPTALLKSILQLNPVQSWQCGYNVNLRFQTDMLTDPAHRARVAALVDAFFSAGGQELQLNCVDPATLRAAQDDPASYRDLVVRVAGFSEFFTKLEPAIQDDIIGRTEHVA